MEKAITILSGGLDSAVATCLAARKYKISLAITFDYGQRAKRREIGSAAHLCRMWKIRHKIIKLDFLRTLAGSALTDSTKRLPHLKESDFDRNKERLRKCAKAVWVPNRNALFINIAASFAEANNTQKIVTGFNIEEGKTFPDNSQKFLNAANRALKTSTLSKPEVMAPVGKMDKVEILKAALDNKIDITRLWPCYDNGHKWCGICESCVRLKRALKQLDQSKDYRKFFK